MKKIFYLSLFLTIALFSCNKIPEARFTIFPEQPVVGQEIIFYNDSKNAENYEWDFGDGYFSNAQDPTHWYDVTGVFEVKLTAFSKSDLTDEATLTIDVLQPTLLDIIVLEYFQEYPVANARVRLYPDSISWDLQQNLVTEGWTENDGTIVFANLEPKIYYVDVFEAHHDNYLLREEDTEFIMTGVIVPHRINWFIAWVDYYDKKGAGRHDNQYLLKKPARQITEKNRQVNPLEEDWQTLYKRSIKVK